MTNSKVILTTTKQNLYIEVNLKYVVCKAAVVLSLLNGERTDGRTFLSVQGKSNFIQDCFLQKEARVFVSNAFVLEDSMFK